MMTTDPIADMLTRIRNATAVGKTSVSLPYSKIKAAIADILVAQGYLVASKQSKNGVFASLDITLSGAKKTPREIHTLERVSKPGRRVYAGVAEIPRVLSGRGIVIVSTSSGIMTGHEARKKGLGGELICKVW